MTLRSLLFDWPLASVLLFLVPAIAWFFYRLYRWRQECADAFARPEIAQKVFVERSSALFWIKAVLISLSFAAAVIALMQPKGNERYLSSGQQEQARKGGAGKGVLRRKMHEVVLVVDVSASMGIADGEGGKTRLSIAKEIADQLIGGLRGESVSLYTFTSATMREVPATMDYFFTRLLLRGIAINEGETSGTDITQALNTLREKIQAMPSTTTKTLVLLSDGGDTSLYGLAGAQRQEALNAILAPALKIGDSHTNLFTVGIGSVKEAPVPGVAFEGKAVESALDTELMGRLALAGGGSYLVPSQSSPFRVAQELSRIVSRRGEYVDTASEALPVAAGGKAKVYDLLFQIPLGVAFLALFLALVLPDSYLRTDAKVGDYEPRYSKEA